ncbi:hypothetical protein KP509_25G048500 [Ceratopteris richardii]|uniref:Bet v I/Major latex protein domain-containing protein n=1 Tax=Ceratopteris richardii TaxID=49495 RepID=A0A8T2RSK2_CERRI|nr:hypothetical protein KP509_25G048500 [Ceratopteris richardii]
MASVQLIQVKEEVAQAAEKVWKYHVKYMDTEVHASMRSHFTSFRHIQGPPLTPGSIVMVTYGQEFPHYKFMKFRWDEINHEQHRYKNTIIDGGLLNKHFSHLSYTFNILPGSTAESCVMVFGIEYVDKHDHAEHHILKEELEKFIRMFEAHLRNKE